MGFTGLSDPYEEPTDANVIINADYEMPEQSVEAILHSLSAMRGG